MLPWIFSAEGGENEGGDNNGESLAEYYQNYERDQKRMHDMQMEAVRKRDEAMGRRPRRSRSRTRSRSVSRHRSRSHGRSRSRSRSRRHRSRTRSRSRSRDRSRDRERRRYRGRSRSPRRRSRSRSRGRDRGYDRDRNDKNERDTTTAPSNKLAMMSLPHDVDRNMITMVMAAEGFLPQDVRVIHRGTTRSFGFIDFADIDSAVKWMEATEGWLILTDGRRISVQYAKPDPASGGRISNNDWICANCTCNNFFKREACFKCDTPKSQSDDMERAGMHMIGVVPCDTLLIRNLPPGVSTGTIFEGLIKNVNLACIIQLQLADSHQHAFIQMRSTDDATLLVNSSYKNPLKIENHDAILTYCKHPLKEILRQQQIALHAATAQPLPSSGGPVSGAEVAHAAMMRLAQNRGQETQGFNPLAQKQHPYYNPTVQQQMQQPPPPVQQPKQPPGVIGTTNTPHGVLPKYATPNPVTFVLDQATGYFRDPVTGFLYDAKSTYYYMQENGVWACWDATYCTYFSVSAVPENQEATAADAKKEDPKEKTAVDVTKQMQKWAKKQEKQKLQITMKPLVKPLETKSVFDKPGPSGAGEESKVIPVEEPIRRSLDSDEEDSPNASRKKSFEEPVQNRRLPTLQEQREMMELALIDEGKKMCLLCKRAFPSVDVLRKHVDKSDLHRKNLEERRAEWARKYADADDTAASSVPEPEAVPKMVYRDRAKERRAQYGLDGGYGKEDFASSSGGPKTAESLRRDAEAKAATPLDSNNIGNKLLKSMGWKEGQGAGKYGQGIVTPIEAVRRVEGAGLGSSGSKILHTSESTHKERVRASMYNRYREISEQQP